MNSSGVIFALIIAAVVIVALWMSWQRQVTLNSIFQTLARTYGGRCDLAVFGDPSLQLDHRYPARLELRNTAGEHQRLAQLIIPWPERHLRCEVYPDRMVHQVKKRFLGLADVEIGHARFDRDYIVSGTSQNELRALLSEEVRVLIDEIRSIPPDGVNFRIQSGSFMLQKLASWREVEPFERFVSLGLELFDQCLATQSAGIEIVSSSAPTRSDEALCQVCGENVIKAAAVYCRSCRTPHHADCWQYYGSCSTYGCGETRYLVRRKK